MITKKQAVMVVIAFVVAFGITFAVIRYFK